MVAVGHMLAILAMLSATRSTVRVERHIDQFHGNRASIRIGDHCTVGM